MKVVFIHPDLGIGGAERLVVDAALALRSKDHEVEFVVNRFSKDHCFQEVLDFNVHVVDYFPRSIFGKMTALCAYIRMCLAALFICRYMTCDVIFCDSISAAVPIFKWFSSSKVLFYCHFPDQLLTQRKSFLKQVYRYFLDWFESWSTNKADIICVNSHFTENTVRATFPNLAGRDLHVLYPTLNTDFFDKSPEVDLDFVPAGVQHLFLSINRFEVKKNIELAIIAYAKLLEQLSPEQARKCFLVVAGGYDVGNTENILYYDKLSEEIQKLGIPDDRIALVKSPSDVVKIELLRRANMVIYTPLNEHFGIVPLEAMYMGSCVLATNTGGPTETIVDSKTGYLCAADAYSFSLILQEAVSFPEKIAELGMNGRQRVQRVFSFNAFTAKLDRIITHLYNLQTN